MNRVNSRPKADSVGGPIETTVGMVCEALGIDGDRQTCGACGPVVPAPNSLGHPNNEVQQGFVDIGASRGFGTRPPVPPLQRSWDTDVVEETLTGTIEHILTQHQGSDSVRSEAPQP